MLTENGKMLFEMITETRALHCARAWFLISVEGSEDLF
jgi:hypothetical protein